MRKKSPHTARKILDAARVLILETGFRATTMEAIAAHARIAKGTLYAYFPDKDAVFAGLIEDLADLTTDAFTEAFADEGPIAERVGRGLAAKYGAVADLLAGSDFAHELIGEHNRLASRLDAADTAIGEMIVAEMNKAGIADAKRLMDVLGAACMGLLTKLTTPRAVREGVLLLCERVVR